MAIMQEALSDGLKSLGIVFASKNKAEGELIIIKQQVLIEDLKNENKTLNEGA